MQRNTKTIRLLAGMAAIACFGQITLPARAGVPCPGNIVQTGQSAFDVDIDDLILVIATWGPCPSPPAGCPANVNQTGNSANRVDIDDLLVIFALWGPCP